MSRYPRSKTSPMLHMLKGGDLDLVVKQLVLERIEAHLRSKSEDAGAQPSADVADSTRETHNSRNAILSHPLVHVHTRAQLR